MQPLTTLGQMLEAAGMQYACYDMGRRVVELTREQFDSFELGTITYPLPLKRKAWFALLLTDPRQQAQEPLIWFMQLPLDELGKVNLAARDECLHLLIERLGGDAGVVQDSEGLGSVLEGNPYVFQPNQERLAVLHARITARLGQSPSHYYAHALAYFNGELGWEQWPFIGLQGIADIAVRLETDDNPRRIAEAIPYLPLAPLQALCHCLENIASTEDIGRALHARIVQVLGAPAPELKELTALLRGMAGCNNQDLRNRAIKLVLQNEIADDVELLAAIAGRAWESLQDAGIRTLFLERLAGNPLGQGVFDNLMMDLLFLPTTREAMLSSLSQAGHPPLIKERIKGLRAKLTAALPPST